MSTANAPSKKLDPNYLKGLLNRGEYTELLRTVDKTPRDEVDPSSALVELLATLYSEDDQRGVCWLRDQPNPVQYGKALLAFRDENPKLACTLFEEMARHPQPSFRVPEHSGFHGMFTVEKPPKLATPSPLAVSGKNPDGRPVISSACDGAYFQDYAVYFLASIKRNAPDFHAHIHVVNPSSMEFCAELVREYGPETATVSFEKFDGENARQYYALSRYFMAPRLMQTFPSSPLYTTDIDLAITDQMPDFHTELSQRDAAGFSSAYFHRLATSKEADVASDTFKKMPWRAILAGISYFPASERGKYVASLASHYSRVKFDTTPQAWWLDQAVLFSISSFREELGAELQFFQRPQSIEFHTLKRAKETGITDRKKYLAFITGIDAVAPAKATLPGTA